MFNFEIDQSDSVSKKKVAHFISLLRERLKSLPASTQFKITDQEWAASASIDIPLSQKPFDVKGYFQFKPPSKVLALGSIMYDTMLSQDKPMIDLCVLPPKDFYDDKDHLNHRYFRKRAFYLTWIAVKLRDHNSDLVRNLRFSFDYHPMRPVLIFRSAKKNLKVDFRLLIGCQEFIRLDRFLPQQNNIRPHWFKNVTQRPDTDSYLATPFYNSMILQDLSLISSHTLIQQQLLSENKLKECIKIVKAWSKRKGFQKLLTFPLTMFVIYLFQKNVLKAKMNPTQMFRQTLLAFVESKWDTVPIYLSDDEPEHLKEFKSRHEVIFLDGSGRYNLCYQLSKDIYDGARHEAGLTLQVLDTDCDDSLPKALAEVTFNDKFDNLIIINRDAFKKAQGLTEQIDNDLIDHSDQNDRVFIKYVIFLINKGLSKRIKLIQQDLTCYNEYEWSINEDKLLASQKCHYVKLGILLNPEGTLDTIDKGPSADLEIAQSFRDFWKSKSELRRFQDGSICETVYWEAKCLAERRAIVAKAIKHILKEHLNLTRSMVKVTGAELDFSLYVSKTDESNYGTGEEKIKDVISSFDRLAKKLRSVKGLSHTLSSIQGTSAVFRASDVFPPKMDIPLNYSTKNYTLIQNCFAFSSESSDNIYPHWYEPLDVIASLEVGGKWPNDLEALKKARTLFYLDLSQALHSQFNIHSKPSAQYIDAFHEGLVFRIHLEASKEINLLKYKVDEQGKQIIVESDEIERLQLFSQIMPLVTNSLNTINGKYLAYSCSVRMTKRWLACHLLLDHLNEIVIDLVAAYVFLHSYPYSSPQSPMVGFLRILWVLANHEWKSKPLIVNFNNVLSFEEVTKIEKAFAENRNSFPSMAVFTPYNKSSSFWTKEEPIEPIFHRLIKLAQATYITFNYQLDNIFKSDFMILFTPPVNIYHMSIDVKKKHVPNFHLNLSFTKHFSSIHPSITSDLSISASGMPIVHFNLIRLFVQKLRNLYSNYALFFYDKYGGYRIYVIWKPNIFDSRPFIYRQISDCKLTDTLAENGRPNVTLNVEALIEDIEMIGKGLIDKIEIFDEKWS